MAEGSTDQDSHENGEAVEPESSIVFFTDAAIRGRDEDTLGRRPFAELVAAQVKASPGRMVFGLTGEWGSGKTSIINMVAEILEDGGDRKGARENAAAPGGDSEKAQGESTDARTDHGPVVLRFDPGLFSGTEQLVEHFFEELAAQFVETGDSGLQKVGKLMSDYGPMLGGLKFLPVVGPVVGSVGDLTGRVGDRVRGDNEPPLSINKQREKLKEALEAQLRPIVVIIDDLDRLRAEEIRDLVKLVRLNADFPKTTYLICYDRERVERALGASEFFVESASAEEPQSPDGQLAEGRAYLEKIVQLTYEVPYIRPSDLSNALEQGLNAKLEEVGRWAAATQREEIPLDQERLGAIFSRVVRPLLGSLRDVKRYLNLLPAAFELTYGEVALEDVVALEAIRLQLPQLHGQILAVSEPLTHIGAPAHNAASQDDREAEDERKKRVQSFVAAAGEGNRELVQHFLTQIFPAAARHLGEPFPGPTDQQRWRRERRVADQAALTTYLFKQVTSGRLPTKEVAEIITAASDQGQLMALLASKEPDALETLVERVRDYADVIEEGQVAPLAEAFLENLSRMRTDSEGPFSLPPDPRVLGLVQDLLRQITGEDERARAVEEILANVTSLGAKLELTDMVADSAIDTRIAARGEPVQPGEALVSVEKARELDELAFGHVAQTDPAELAAERNPVQTLADIKRIDRRAESQGAKSGRGAAYVEQALDNDNILLAVLESSLTNKYVLGSGGVDRAEETFQPQYLTGLVGEERAAELVGELASNAERRPHPEDAGARALEVAVDYFSARPLG